MTKYLGIDYGSKRVGLAFSDSEGILAFPKTVLKNDKMLLENIKNIYSREGVEGIVLGESIDSQGQPNYIMKKITPFKKQLEKGLNTLVYLEPEFMTSHHAAIGEKKGEFKKNIIDASAAALILQRFLDKRNN